LSNCKVTGNSAQYGGGALWYCPFRRRGIC